MDFKTATKILAQGSTVSDFGDAIAHVANMLDSYGDESALCDWVRRGRWTGGEEFEEIKTEWEAVNSDILN